MVVLAAVTVLGEGVRDLVERRCAAIPRRSTRSSDVIGDPLHSVARRILRDPYLAQDATQRALLDAWRYLPSLRDPDRFEAWIYRLLVRACYGEDIANDVITAPARCCPIAGRSSSTRPHASSSRPARHRLPGTRRRAPDGRRLGPLRGAVRTSRRRGHGDARGHGPISPPLRPETPPRGCRGRRRLEHEAGTA